jgi:mevalonate kinase
MRETFSAKILLFGEYTVIRGGSALAIPFNEFSGRWVKTGAPSFDWNVLIRFLRAHPELEIDTLRLERDLAQGGGFTSTIPQGKGLGSSGALVAGLLAAYGPGREWSIAEAQSRLAGLEACYHGQSSGLDPLVSWLGKPIIIDHVTGPSIASVPTERWRELDRWFLLDSGVARHSAPLIAVFKEKAQTSDFQERLVQLEGLASEAIECYEHLDEPMMGIAMQELSRLQLEAMAEMIPAALKTLWEQGLKDRTFALKLCGAGGGGYFLGYRLKGYPRKVLKF